MMYENTSLEAQMKELGRVGWLPKPTETQTLRLDPR